MPEFYTHMISANGVVALHQRSSSAEEENGEGDCCEGYLKNKVEEEATKGMSWKGRG